MGEVVVRTAKGALRGRTTANGSFFGGVPYAAPPDGERRYAAPQPAPAWDGTRDATAPGPPLPQAERRLPGLASGTLLGTAYDGDPQLTLNVWTPDPGARGLPVLVWLHGGAFLAGSPGQPIYDGDAWARDGVVVVTVGYRLGIEGLVGFAGGDTNVGLRDQLAALEWVQEEIAAFGGDPGRVCVAGQSAGAMSLGWLLGCPRSRGLLQRAISMSGGVELTLSPAQGERLAAFVAARVGVAPTADAMRAVPIPRVVAAQAAITPDQVDLAGPDEPAPGFTGLLWLAPVRDGDIVAEDPLAALAASGAVTLLAGDTEEEGLLYVAGGPAFDEQAQALGAAITEHIFHGPTARLLARHAEVARDATFAYRFTWRSSALGGRLGAAHAIDLPFVFETLDTPGLAGSDDALLGPEGGPAELASAMHAAWVRFVAGGDPGWAPHPHVERF